MPNLTVIGAGCEFMAHQLVKIWNFAYMFASKVYELWQILAIYDK